MLLKLIKAVFGVTLTTKMLLVFEDQHKEHLEFLGGVDLEGVRGVPHARTFSVGSVMARSILVFVLPQIWT